MVSKNNMGKHLIFIAILVFSTALCFVSGLLQPKELLSTICLLIVLWILRNAIKRYKNLFTNVLLSLFAVWVIASVIDIGYHLYLIYAPKPLGERIESKVETIFKYRPNQVIYDSARYGDLAEMGRLTKEYPQTRKIVCQIDELGYRNPIGQKNKKNKVLLIGDSFGFGAMTDGENIADYLRKGGMETYNLSLPGYGPWQEFYTLRQEIDKINKADTCTVVWLLFTGNDLAGRFDSVNVADRKTNWRDDFYSFRKKSPLRKSFLEIVNPKVLADKGVFEKDGRLFYEPYFKEEQKDSLSKNKAPFLKTISKGIEFCKNKNVRLRIVLISPKEFFLTKRRRFFYLQDIAQEIVGLSDDWDLVIYPAALRRHYDERITITLEDYIVNDSHLNSEGNKKINWLINDGLYPIQILPPDLKNKSIN